MGTLKFGFSRKSRTCRTRLGPANYTRIMLCQSLRTALPLMLHREQAHERNSTVDFALWPPFCDLVAAPAHESNHQALGGGGGRPRGNGKAAWTMFWMRKGDIDQWLPGKNCKWDEQLTYPCWIIVYFSMPKLKVCQLTVGLLLVNCWLTVEWCSSHCQLTVDRWFWGAQAHNPVSFQCGRCRVVYYYDVICSRFCVQ